MQTRVYIEHCKGAACDHWAALLEAGHSAAESGLVSKYVRGEIKQKRHMAPVIASQANASIVTAQRVVALYENRL